MSKIVAFEIQVGGITQVLTNMDEVKVAAKAIKTELDKTQFGTKEFDKLNSSLGAVKQTQAAVAQQARNAQQEFIKSADSGKNSYRAMNAELVLLRRSFKDLSEEERSGKVGSDLTVRIRGLDGELKKIDASIGLHQRNVGNYVGALGNYFQASTQAVAGAVGGQGGNLLGIAGGGIGQAGAQALSGNVLGGSIALVAAVASLSGEFVTINKQVADAAANVQKTSGLSGEAISQLTGQLKQLDTRTTLVGLLGIGEVLGQLGVTVDTKTIAAIDKLNVALGDEFGGDSKAIVGEVGKLKQVFTEFAGQDYGESVLRIGNALNVLGATGAATAPTITDFSKRIAGTVGPLGVSSASILGVSATLEELGTNAERGATGFSRVIQEIATSPEAFEKTLGITKEAVKGVNSEAKNFKDLANRDLFGAFNLVLGRLKELNLSNVDFSQTLKSLKITGQGELEVLGKLSQAQDLLTSRVKTAADALTNQDSILAEFGVKNENLAGQLEQLGNNITEAFVNSEVSGSIANTVSGINDWIRGNDALSESLLTEQANINSVVYTITSANTSQEKRIQLIEELQRQYPEYFSNLNAETVSNQQLVDVLKLVNAAYSARIAITQNNEEIESVAKDNANDIIRLERQRLSLFKEVSKGFQDINRGRSVPLVQTGDLGKDITKLLQLDARYGELYKTLLKLNDEQTIYDTQNNKRLSKTQDLIDLNTNIAKSAKLIDEASLNNVISTKDQTLAEIELIKELVKKKDLINASVRLAKLNDNVSNVLKPVNLQAVSFVAENTTGPLQKLAVDTKSSVDIIKSAIAEAKALIKSQTTLESPGGSGGSGASKVARADIQINEDAEKKFSERRIKLEDELSRQLSDARVDSIKNQTERQIAAENERYNQVLIALDRKNTDREEAELKAQDELDKSLEKVRARLKDSPGDKDAQKKEKLLIERKSLFTKQSATDEAEFISKVNEVKEAEAVKHNVTLLKITEDAEKKRLDSIKKGQSEAFKFLEDYFQDQKDLAIESGDDLIEQITKNRDKQLNDATASLTGGALVDAKATIELNYELSKSATVKQKLQDQLKALSTELATAETLNNVNTSLGLDPTFAESDLEKLRKQVEKTQKEITKIEDDESAKREKRTAEETQKKIEEQKKFQEEIRDAAFDAAGQISNALLEIEQTNANQQLEKEKDALDKQYDRRLKKAKGNAKEEERLSNELAQKKEALDREAAEKNQEFAVKRALIDGALAIIKAYATLDPVSATIAAAFTAIVTAAQIAVIKEQSFASGGFTGDGYGTPDSSGYKRAGVVHEGEYVIPQSILRTPEGRAYVNRLEAMRIGRGGSLAPTMSYADGGFVGPAGTVKIVLDDQSMNRLADKLYEASLAGTKIGTLEGNTDVNRRNERQDNLTNRTEI